MSEPERRCQCNLRVETRAARGVQSLLPSVGETIGHIMSEIKRPEPASKMPDALMVGVP